MPVIKDQLSLGPRARNDNLGANGRFLERSSQSNQAEEQPPDQIEQVPHGSIHGPIGGLRPSGWDFRQRQEAARLGFAIETVEVPTPAALDQAFDELRRYRPDLLLIVPDNALISLSEQIVPRALAERVPTVATSRILAGVGALVTYGFLLQETVERTGTYLKRILAGASPADLPIEQPTIFRLVVNL